MKNIAIVTGASSGMGREFVRQLDEACSSLDEIWIVARRAERLQALAEEIRTPARIIACDLANANDLKRLQERLQRESPVIRMLVNSAGFGVIGNFETGSFADEIGMITVNCVSLTAVTHFCLPYMRKNSRIIQLASSASFLPQPGFGVYAASKSYVLSFSRALGMELKDRGIIVTAVCPGPVNTEFFQLAEKGGHKIAAYKMLVMADPVKVVKKALRSSAAKRPVSVYGLPMNAFQIAAKVLPHSLMLEGMRLIGKLSD